MLAENIKNIYLGASPVQKMYLGSTLIYPREPAVDDYVMLGTTTGSTDFMIGRGDLNTSEPADDIQVHVVQKPGGNNEMYVKQDDVLKIPFNLSNTAGFNSTEGNKITSISKWKIDTSNVTSVYRMFFDCSSLNTLNLSNFSTSNVTDMGSMFSSCSKLKTLDLSNFSTSNVTKMNSMFAACSSLTSLDVSNFSTSNVTDMSSMFYSCSSLKTLDVSNFNTSNVTDMGQMFHNCAELESLDLRSFDTRGVEFMFYMFFGCYSLTSLNVSNFNTLNVKNMVGMFEGCSKLNKLYLSSSFFKSRSITTYDFSKLTSWTDKESLDMFHMAIIDTDGHGKTLKFSSNTYNALESYYIDNIKSRGWKIIH